MSKTILIVIFFFFDGFKSTSLRAGSVCSQTMLAHYNTCHMQARGIDRNALDGFFMAWKVYSGMPLQQTSYTALFVASYNLPIRQGWKFYSSPKLWKITLHP